MRPKTTSKLRDLHNQLDLVRLGKLKILMRIQVAREGREDLGKVGSMMWRYVRVRRWRPKDFMT